MAVRGLNARGFGGSSDLAAGIAYAAENGADVVSNSWGGYTGIDAVTRDAVLLADALGVVVVAAAGNNADTTAGYGLAPYPTVITVAATMQGDQIAAFSSFGDEVSVSAPGWAVLSTRASVAPSDGTPVGNAGYFNLSGTSMADAAWPGWRRSSSPRTALAVRRPACHRSRMRSPSVPGFEGSTGTRTSAGAASTPRGCSTRRRSSRG
jgi:hypothetical protein